MNTSALAVFVASGHHCDVRESPGDRLKRAAKLRGFWHQTRGVKVRELGRAALLSPPVITRLMQNQDKQAEVLTLQKLADALNVSFEWLALGRGEMVRSESRGKIDAAVDRVCDELSLSEELRAGVEASLCLGATESDVRDVYRRFENGGDSIPFTARSLCNAVLAYHEWSEVYINQRAAEVIPLHGRDVSREDMPTIVSYRDALDEARRGMKAEANIPPTPPQDPTKKRD